MANVSRARFEARPGSLCVPRSGGCAGHQVVRRIVSAPSKIAEMQTLRDAAVEASVCHKKLSDDLAHTAGDHNSKDRVFLSASLSLPLSIALLCFSLAFLA